MLNRVIPFLTAILLAPLLLLSLQLIFVPSAVAAILTPHLAYLDQHQEAPGQVLYKSFTTLHDQRQQAWRAIAFNHSLPDGSHNFRLRLVGFPGKASIDRSRPLILKTALGQSFNAPDASAQIAIDEGMDELDVPPNVAQYDLAPVVSQLKGAVPLRLTLPLLDSKDGRFLILPNVVQEWKSVAAGDR